MSIRTQKRRREIASVLVELSTAELEIEVVRRSLSRTDRAILLQSEALRNLQRKQLNQTAEICRLQALIDGGAR